MDAQLALVGFRPTILWDEIKRIVAEELPPFVARLEPRAGLVMPSLTGTIVRGERPPEQYPYLCLDVNVGLQEAGSTPAFAAHNAMPHIAVALIAGPRDNASGLADLWDLAVCIACVMLKHAGSHCDPLGRVCWNSISLSNVASMRDLNWVEAEGVGLSFTVRQMPGHDRWKLEASLAP